MDLKAVVSALEHNVAAQTDAMARGDHEVGNTHARIYIDAFKKLRAIGDSGRAGGS